MKSSLIYWITVAIFGSVHLQFLINSFFPSFPYYMTYLFTAFFLIILKQKVILQLRSLPLTWHIMLACMQILLILNYMEISPEYIAFILFVLFIGIEYLRIHFSHVLFTKNEELKSLLEEEQHMNETFRVVRSERHDFLKHISAMHFMLDNEQYEEAFTYLNDLVDQYEETNLSIKGERGTVAGILHHMYQKGKHANIEVVYDLDVPLSTLPISDKEMVTLIGNLLSNSIDACVEWQKENQSSPLLSLQFYKRSGLYILVCKNTSLPIPREVLDSLYTSYGNTTKTGDHQGLGTKMIDDIIQKYNGNLDFTYKKEEFTVKIKIPAIHNL